MKHVLGLDNGVWYLFWSGIFFVLVLFIGQAANVAVTYRKHNCHVHGCWRMGRHPVEGTAYVVCRRHHPDGHVTAGHVLARFREVKAGRHLVRPSGPEGRHG